METVRVKFVTKMQDMRVPSTPIDVPTTLTREGLSEILNHLLGMSKLEFQILCIEDELLLQSTIAEHLMSVGKSTESILTLEYFIRSEAPKQNGAEEHPDWVSCVDGQLGTHLVTGCYDGAIRVFDTKGQTLATATNHTQPIKAIATHRGSDGEIYIVSASKDRTVVLWQFASDSLSVVAVCCGHTDSVESIAMSKESNKFASGCYDGTICLWNTPTESDVEDSDGPSTKRQKTGDARKASTTSKLAPFALLSGHTQCVGAIAWVDGNKGISNKDCKSALVSGSWDHSLRIWNIDQLCCTRVIHCSKVVTALAVSQNGLIASAHPDHAIRLWDTRDVAETENIIARATLRRGGHNGWVSSLSFQPVDQSESQEVDRFLASVSYDKSMCLWDMRAIGKKTPKNKSEEEGKISRASASHIIRDVHDGKILCVDWRQSNTLATGGDDAKLKRFVLGNITV